MGIFQSKEDSSHMEELRRERLIQQQIRREEQIRREKQMRREQFWQEQIRQEQIRIAQQVANSWSNVHERLSNLHIREEPTDVVVEEIKCDPQLIRNLLECIGQSSWAIDEGTPFVLEELENDSYEFIEQKQLFRKTNKPCFNVTKIQKVVNPYLLLQFNLKKNKQYKESRGLVQIKKMYHGTKITNIAGICENNFDWRKNGNSTGHRFGQGVSFSPFSNFATHYGDKKSYRKVMFAVDILVGEISLGEGNTVIPERLADTTVNAKGSVYVKYEDNTFYPTYLIYYEGFERK